MEARPDRPVGGGGSRSSRPAWLFINKGVAGQSRARPSQSFAVQRAGVTPPLPWDYFSRGFWLPMVADREEAFGPSWQRPFGVLGWSLSDVLPAQPLIRLLCCFVFKCENTFRPSGKLCHRPLRTGPRAVVSHPAPSGSAPRPAHRGPCLIPPTCSLCACEIPSRPRGPGLPFSSTTRCSLSVGLFCSKTAFSLCRSCNYLVLCLMML